MRPELVEMLSDPKRLKACEGSEEAAWPSLDEVDAAGIAYPPERFPPWTEEVLGRYDLKPLSAFCL